MQEVHKLVQIIVEVAQRLILNPQSKVIMFLYSQRSCGLLTLWYNKCLHFQCFITLLKKNHSHCIQNIMRRLHESTGERVKASNTEEHDAILPEGIKYSVFGQRFEHAVRRGRLEHDLLVVIGKQRGILVSLGKHWHKRSKVQAIRSQSTFYTVLSSGHRLDESVHILTDHNN